MRNSHAALLIIVGLVVVTLAVFAQVLKFDFVNLDDNGYITENPRIQQGLTVENIAWAFTTTYQCFWHPIVWISYFVDRMLFGAGAFSFHLTNLLLHTLNAVLLFGVLNHMTRSVWRSGFVASLFAIHPLHVESVAWISQRKDVLSTLFWLAAIWAYLWYCGVDKSQRTHRAGVYAILVVLFVLGLMAKPMLVTLPLLLLLLDFWPLGRFSPDIVGRSGDNAVSPVGRIAALVYEKVPLLILSIGFGILAYVAQRGGGAMSSTESLPVAFRVGNALVSYVVYIMKMFWPRNLAAFYPHPGHNLSFWLAMTSMLLLGGITIAAWYVRGTRQYVLVGWLWYIVTLIPVTGIIQVGSHGMADRYTYVPLIGLFVSASWLIPDLLACGTRGLEVPAVRERQSSFLFALACIVVLSFAMCAHIQCRYWQNSIGLFQRALAATQRNYTAHLNLGMALEIQGQVQQAIRHYSRALRIQPNQWKVWNNLGVALERLDRSDEAMRAYENAARLSGDAPEPHGNMAMLLARAGHLDEAKKHALLAVRKRPQDFLTHNLMGKILADLGEFSGAEAEFRKAIQLRPDFADNHFQLALTLKAARRIKEAISELEETVRVEPLHAQAHIELAVCRWLIGDIAGTQREIAECRKLNIQLPPELLESLSEEPSPGLP